MGYTQPWYSVRGLAEPVGGDMGYFACFLRDGDRVFLTYSTTGRGTEVASGSFALLDLTPYGRGEAWQDTPEGWPEGQHPCWYWRTDVGRKPHLGPGRPPRPAVDPPRRHPRANPRPPRRPPLTRPRLPRLLRRPPTIPPPAIDPRQRVTSGVIEAAVRDDIWRGASRPETG